MRLAKRKGRKPYNCKFVVDHVGFSCILVFPMSLKMDMLCFNIVLDFGFMCVAITLV